MNTIDVERRNYGRRYTGLYVDELDRASFTIDCAETHMRPELYDLCEGDIVRWKQGDRYVQATIATIHRNGVVLQAHLGDATLLAPDFFPY